MNALPLSKQTEALHDEVLSRMRAITEDYPYDPVDHTRLFLFDQAHNCLNVALQCLRGVEQLEENTKTTNPA